MAGQIYHRKIKCTVVKTRSGSIDLMADRKGCAAGGGAAPAMRAPDAKTERRILDEAKAFMRYGQNAFGRLRTAVCACILFPPRIAIFLTATLTLFATYRFLRAVGYPRAYRLMSYCWYVWFWCLGIWRVEYEGEEVKSLPTQCISISNHIGLLEIFWAWGRYCPSFLAKSEVRGIPIIGECASEAGVVWIDRDSKNKGSDTIKAMRDCFKTGTERNLFIFPEATTTNGEQLLAFRKGAFLLKKPIIPYVFSHPGFRRGFDFDPHYTTVQIWLWMFGLMCQPYTRFKVKFLPVQYPRDEETALQFMKRVEALIAKESGLPVVQRAYKHKRALDVLWRKGLIKETTIYEYQRERLENRKSK